MKKQYKDRYARNHNTISQEENDRLKDFRVLVAGSGGLGGFIIEELGRLGIGHITAVDGDVFEESNLNRQLLSTEALLGTPKAEAAGIRMQAVNSEVEVIPKTLFITEENCEELIAGHDLVVDALDRISVRLLLEDCCEKQGIPLIHGAIGGWYGQVTSVFPGDRTLHQLYPLDEKTGEPLTDKGAETELGNPSFTPAVIASIQTAEAVKTLLGREGVLRKKLLTIDLLEQEYNVIDL